MTQLQYITLDVFNLTPGVAFTNLSPDSVNLNPNHPDWNPIWVVVRVHYKHINSERIGILCRKLDTDEQRDGTVLDGPSVYQFMDLSWGNGDVVYCVGIVGDPDSWDDNDFGQHDVGHQCNMLCNPGNCEVSHAEYCGNLSAQQADRPTYPQQSKTNYSVTPHWRDR